MKLVPVSELFDVKYGINLELNKLKFDKKGINFVSRTERNNGVSAKVKVIKGVEPNPPNTISVAGGGSVMESFLQLEPYYSGRDLYYLMPKVGLKREELIYYCACLRTNKYRYNYGRQANRTLRSLLIPSHKEIPDWVYKTNFDKYNNLSSACEPTGPSNLLIPQWRGFRYNELFVLKKGKRLTKADFIAGSTPFIGSIDSNNGYREYIGQKPNHTGNTITVNYNGSVAEAFYQPEPYWASDDVNVLYPKFKMSIFIGLFIVSLIKLEKYRFNYGRKWHLDRMNSSVISLPVNIDGSPDFEFMERYIKTLKYSKHI